MLFTTSKKSFREGGGGGVWNFEKHFFLISFRVLCYFHSTLKKIGNIEKFPFHAGEANHDVQSQFN